MILRRRENRFMNFNRGKKAQRYSAAASRLPLQGTAPRPLRRGGAPAAALIGRRS